MPPQTSLALFQLAEVLYSQGKVKDAFEYYQKAIKKILKDENVVATLPAMVPPEMPKETLGFVWNSFTGFIRDPAIPTTPESDPEAFKLLNSFRPGHSTPHPRLERTPRGQLLLKGMQVVAGLTLGLHAWDKKDRATAAKRYREALQVADTVNLPAAPRGLEKWMSIQIQEVRDNLAMLMENDTRNAAVLNAAGIPDPHRRDVVNLPMPTAVIHGNGEVSVEHTTMFASNACAKCGKRDVRLLRCGKCRQVQCKWLHYIQGYTSDSN